MAAERLYRSLPVKYRTAAKDKSQKKPYVVLIVDDAETDRTTYRRYIEAAAVGSVTFVEAESGEYGLALCQQLSPSLILLDYRLPDIDGLEFLQALKSQARVAPPVIMLTGQGNEQAAVEAMKLGARDYLVKGELSATSLSHAVTRVQSQQALQSLMSRQERAQALMMNVSQQIAQADSLKEIMDTLVVGTREILACDRVLVYQFAPDLSGMAVAESVLPKWRAAISKKNYRRIEDNCFKQESLNKYQQGYITAIENVAKADFSDCHLEMLKRFDVKANLAVPILVYNHQSDACDSSTSTVDRKVWGLLIAHSCQAPRSWREDEMTLLSSLALQLAIAIRQTSLFYSSDSMA